MLVNPEPDRSVKCAAHWDGKQMPEHKHRVRGLQRPPRALIPKILLLRLHVHKRNKPCASGHIPGKPVDPPVRAWPSAPETSDKKLSLSETEIGE